jgi:hypothetical protein
MSGGHFDYVESRLRDVAEEIQQQRIVATLDNQLAPQTLDEFQKAIDLLNVASVYLQRIDYLLSGDDGEDTFHKRLQADLRALNVTSPTSIKCLMETKGVYIHDVFTPGVYIIKGVASEQYQIVKLSEELISNMKIAGQLYEDTFFYGPVPHLI